MVLFFCFSSSLIVGSKTNMVLISWSWDQLNNAAQCLSVFLWVFTTQKPTFPQLKWPYSVVKTPPGSPSHSRNAAAMRTPGATLSAVTQSRSMGWFWDSVGYLCDINVGYCDGDIYGIFSGGYCDLMIFNGDKWPIININVWRCGIPPKMVGLGGKW